MAIVEMSSFRLMAYKEKRQALLQELQRMGDVHLAQGEADEQGFLRPVPARNLQTLEKQRDIIHQYIVEIERYEKSSRKLVSRKERQRLIKRSIDVDTLTFEELEKRASQIDIQALLGVMDESQALSEGLAQGSPVYYIEPWKGQKLSDKLLMELRDAKPIIGTVPAEAEEAFAQDVKAAEHILAIVRRERDGQVLFILKPSLDQVENAQILAEKHHLRRRSAEAVRMNREVLALQSSIDRMLSRRNRRDGSLQKLAARKLDLMISYEYLQNMIVRCRHEQRLVQTEAMVLATGWVPTRRISALEKAAAAACGDDFFLKHEPVSRLTGDAPVLLQNNRFTSAFESVTKMYATPRYSEVDPTPVFAPFYLLFFGMMLSDVGYGLLMALVSLAALTLFALKPSFRKMVQFLFYLSFSTMLWGLVYGSFFGGIVPLPRLISPSTEYTSVLIMSMALGVVHLFTALGVKAYLYIRGGLGLYALFDVGFWYMLLLSGIALAAKMFLPALPLPQPVILGVMIAGAVGILLTNGRSAKTAPGKLVSGLYSLYGVTNYISDIVSYSRLMALGLAGGSIGMAVNMIVGMIGGPAIIKIVAGGGIFIFFHLFNLFISGLSSYVHASRLTYVEFFGKFYAGGGTDFTPMRAKNTYINVV